MELRDKNGLTEREYLAQYRADKYPRASCPARRTGRCARC